MSLLTLDDRPGPASRVSRERAQAMVDAALAELPLAAATSPARVHSRGRGSKLRTLGVAAAALLGVMGGAAAARWYFTQRAPAPAPAVAPAAPQASAPDVLPAAPEPAPAVEPAEPADATEPSERRSVAHGAPEDLLQRANRLRTIGRFRDSAQTYASVSERYPNTLSAYVAQVAAGSLELEHLGRPARARKLFERALREHPEGALDLEARQGLATALRDLGDTRAELDVLRSLIELHAGSPAARRAESRLREIGSKR